MPDVGRPGVGVDRGVAPIFSLGRAACKAAQADPARHAVRLDADPCLAAWGDAERLERALALILRTAIAASEPGVPVHVATARRGDAAVLVVAVRRAGPAARLDVGEAEVLVRAIGGRLETTAAPGGDTRVTILLRAADFPAVERRALPRPAPQRA